MFSRPISEIIQKRFSCRSYAADPISPENQALLRERIGCLAAAPFGTPLRIRLIAAETSDSKALRGLGTYGFIKGATAFLVGVVPGPAVPAPGAKEPAPGPKEPVPGVTESAPGATESAPGEKDLEDFGYQMEQMVLYATDLDLGTCWLGGTFTRSRFAARMNAAGQERIPAVISMGRIDDEARARQTIVRQGIGSDHRLPWEQLFFDGQFGVPLSRERAGGIAAPLEMVRLGPSASNKQPWRVVQDGHRFHFYVQRTRGYRNVATRLAGVADMQRIDLGIAMCHFELTARELGLNGSWVCREPGIAKPDDLTEYSASWVPDDGGIFRE